MTKRAILVVDDNAVNARLIAMTLELAGFDVACAGDATSALAAITTRRPRLILMDLQLPGMDGLTLARSLKADPATSDIAIVAVTAYAMKGDEERALAAGCDGYIAKPIDTRALAGVVAGHLEARPA